MLKDLVTLRDNCRVCKSTHLECVLPLQPIPIISPNVDDNLVNNSNNNLQTAPIDVYLCTDCGLTQLIHIVDPCLQYQGFKYETSLSLGLSDHFAEQAKEISENYLSENDMVLDIGSNDGTTLKYYKKYGANVVGVDPAKNIAKKATESGIPTIGDFFTSGLASTIEDKYGKIKVILSNNTLANIDNLDDIISGIKTILAADGVFIVETQYGPDVFNKNLLDVIYHEHLSYFALKPFEVLMNKHGMQLINAELIAPKGGSIRFISQHKAGPYKKSKNVDLIRQNESEIEKYEHQMYASLRSNIKNITEIINSETKKILDKGGTIAAYGSSVGCASLTNQFSLSTVLCFIVDDHPLKAVLTGPNYNIDIVSKDELIKKMPDLVIILAWRYADSIINKNKEYIKKGGRFLNILPEPKFIT